MITDGYDLSFAAPLHICSGLGNKDARILAFIPPRRCIYTVPAV